MKDKRKTITGYDIRITWNNGDKEWLSELEDYYFKDVDKRNRLSKTLKKLQFSLDSIAYKKDNYLPYQLTIIIW